MPYKKPKIERVYYSIGEVAAILDESPSLIRYWENQFDVLNPKKNKKGNRLFTKDDIKMVQLIHHLVKERGMTLKGARQKLSDNPEETVNNFEIVKRLKKIRTQLIEIRDEMES